jgi:hypothetical protein
MTKVSSVCNKELTMHRFNILAICSLLSISLQAIPAQDKKNVVRVQLKEPAYQTKTPRYARLAFGPEATSVIWLVHDGDCLYVDRNGNGDLTGADAKIHATKAEYTDPKEGTYLFDIGDLKEGSLTHKSVQVYVSKIDYLANSMPIVKTYVEKHPDSLAYMVIIDVEMPGLKGTGIGGRVNQRSSLVETQGVLRFADTPQEAPQLHFRGPWQIALDAGQSITVGREIDMVLVLVTSGKGPGSGVQTAYEKLVPNDIHPQVQITFPPERPEAAPHRELYELKERC